jgi:hypothetical protein
MTVYVPQEILYKNSKGALVPKFSLHKAEEFGDLQVLLPYGNVMLSPQPMIARLRKALQHFSDEDYILAVGDPAAIGATVGIAANNNGGKVSLLRWDRRSNNYIEVPMNLYGGTK